MTDRPILRWGIVGPGSIGRSFADNLARTSKGRLEAIASRDPDRPGLAEAFPGVRRLNGYDALMSDPAIDAVYVATPHSMHAEWAIKAARAGKHVLVEKPFAINARQTEAMFAAARQAKTFMGEAFMYRFLPTTKKLCALVADDAIGEVRLIHSSFGFLVRNTGPDNRILAPQLGGGGILDVGAYAVSMARLIAGVAVGAPFSDPLTVKAVAHIGPTGVDERASALLGFAGGLLAQLSCSVSLEQDNVLRIFGSKGRLELADFWVGAGEYGGRTEIVRIDTDDKKTGFEVIEPAWLYTFQADAVADAVAAGRHEFTSPGMSWADSLGNMTTLDRWRAEIGLRYPGEDRALDY